MAVPSRREICKYTENLLNDLIKSPVKFTTFDCLEHVFYFQLQTWLYVMFGQDAEFVKDQYHYFVQRHYWQYYTLTAAINDEFYLETDVVKMRILADKLKQFKEDVYQAVLKNANSTRRISRAEALSMEFN